MADVYGAFLGKYKKYTEIQELAIGVIAKGSNCIILAPTGAGKTEAAVLPVLDRIARSGNSSGIQLLYITPLRALNRDMIKRLESLCSEIDITVSVRHGDTMQSERGRQGRNPPMVMITTPETLQSILPTKTIGPHLKNISAVIVDEIHELYHSKRGAQLSLALERLEELAPGFQRIGISATVSDPGTVSGFLCGERPCEIAASRSVKEIRVSIELPRRHSGRVSLLAGKFALDNDALARLEAMADFIKGSKSTIIFANTRQVVEALGSRLLYLDGIDPFGGIGVHHSSLDKKERIEIENSFKEGRIKSIIATSSLELGIDIGNIDLVVQYGSPRQALRLVQRAGRSGHSERGRPHAAIIATGVMDAVEALAIARNVGSGRLERFSPSTNALDVLANQICGILLDKGQCGVGDIMRIVNRSFVYGGMPRPEVVRLLEFMNGQRMIGFDGETATAGGRTRMYYYGHLSVIPDSKRFLVKSAMDNRIISSLDEEFVVSNVEDNSVFITKGLPWRVLSIEDNVISVEPSPDLDAAVPDWSGEDIPVSRGVAQEVFRLIGRPSMLPEGGYLGRSAQSEIEDFSRNQQAAAQVGAGALVLEQAAEYKILHTGLGTQANDALSRIMAHELTSRLGRSVNMKSSPYLIFLELPATTDIIPVLKHISERPAESRLREAIPDTDLFRYKFVTVAKLFGIIDRDATVSKSMARRIIRLMAGTPVYNEAMRELMNEHFDIATLKEFLEGIRSGRTGIIPYASDSMSPISKMVLSSAYYTRELIMPVLPSDQIIESFSKFLLSKSMKLLCTYCGFHFSRKLSDLQAMQSIPCPSCASPLVAPYTDEYLEVVKKRSQGKKLGRRESEMMKDVMKQASLFDSYGGRAALALSTYGIGPTSAARVLMMLRKNDTMFYMDLIGAQKQFIKNRKYWSA